MITVRIGTSCRRWTSYLARSTLAGPELRMPGAAARTRIVSVARIRLDSRKSVRSFKKIICHDVSEFESHMASQAVCL
jgi:hypothetical protein